MSRMKGRRRVKKSAVSRECTPPEETNFKSKAEFKEAKKAYKDCKWAVKKKIKKKVYTPSTEYSPGGSMSMGGMDMKKI